MASPQYLVLHPYLSSLPSMIRGHRFFKWRNIEYSLESLVLSVYFSGSWKNQPLKRCMRVHFFITLSLSLSFIFSFFIFPSSFQRIVRAREYFTAGINQRNSGKQLIILLLTISRSFLSLLSLSLSSLSRKIGSGPPTILSFFFFWSTRWDFASDCLLECARDEINVISFP